MFGTPPEDLDLSFPLEPMKLDSVGEQKELLKDLLSELVDTHPTKLKKEEKSRLRDAYRQILLNVIYNSVRRVYTGLPRRKASYDRGTYWRSLGLTYSFAVGALNRLHRDEFIHQKPGFQDPMTGVSRLTRIFAKDKIAERLDVVSIAEHIELASSSETLVFRDFNQHPPELSDLHPDVERLRVVNEFLAGFGWQQKGPIRLIYNKDPIRGGRLYTRFQNLPKKYRAQLVISKQPTVELDYKANHLAMLIAMSGTAIPLDPYMDIAREADQDREKVKKFVTVALGADDEEKAFGGCKRHRINRELFSKLKDATSKLFPSIPLFTGIGLSLQSLEGQIALDIMVEGAKAGIPVLPVHDSFITTVENEEWLRNQMLHYWKLHVDTTSEPRIDKKQ